MYIQATNAGNRYWGVYKNGSGDYFTTGRGYVSPVSAVRQLIISRGNKKYAGRLQHVEQWLEQHGMYNKKINNNRLMAIVRAEDPNLINRVRVAATLTYKTPYNRR